MERLFNRNSRRRWTKYGIQRAPSMCDLYAPTNWRPKKLYGLNLCLREVKVDIGSVAVRVGGRRIRREPRHGPQHASSPSRASAPLVLRTRHVQAAGVFWWARGCATSPHGVPRQLLLRRGYLVPEGVEVAVSESFLVGRGKILINDVSSWMHYMYKITLLHSS